MWTQRQLSDSCHHPSAAHSECGHTDSYQTAATSKCCSFWMWTHKQLSDSCHHPHVFHIFHCWHTEKNLFWNHNFQWHNTIPLPFTHSATRVTELPQIILHNQQTFSSTSLHNPQNTIQSPSRWRQYVLPKCRHTQCRNPEDHHQLFITRTYCNFRIMLPPYSCNKVAVRWLTGAIKMKHSSLYRIPECPATNSLNMCSLSWCEYSLFLVWVAKQFSSSSQRITIYVCVHMHMCMIPYNVLSQISPCIHNQAKRIRSNTRGETFMVSKQMCQGAMDFPCFGSAASYLLHQRLMWQATPWPLIMVILSFQNAGKPPLLTWMSA